MEEKDIINKMPKIELHCHLDGSLDIKTIREIIPASELPQDDEKLKKILQVSKDNKDLTEYLEKFVLPLRGLQTAKHLEKAAYDLIKDVSKENVKYIEIRFAPMLSIDEGMSCSEAIESVIKGAKQGEKDFGVLTNVIVCAMRHHNIETNMKMLTAAMDFLGNGVCALDLAGDEIKYPTKLHEELFKSAKKKGMPFTIHSGETGSVENIKVALDLGASRLGHGIALIKSKELMKRCKKNNIAIEVCPTSNLQTGAIKALSKHPVKDFWKEKLCITVNTDNRTVSGTSLIKEINIVQKICGDFTEGFLKLIYENGIKASFATESVKDKLLKMF